MRKLLCVTVAVAAVWTAVPGLALAAKKPEAEQVKPSELSVINAILRQGYAKTQNDDWAGARESYQAVVSNPAFPKLTPELRHIAYYMLAMAEFYNDEPQAAYEHIVAAVQVAPNEMNASSWLFYAKIAFEAGKPEDAGDAAIRAVTEFPDEARELSTQRIFSIASKIEEIKDDRVRYQKFLEGLRAAGYVSDDEFWTIEPLWFDLFSIYADRGEDAKAQTMADGLASPYSLVLRQIDKRYTRFAPAAEDAYMKVVEGDIALTRATAARHPDKIQGVATLVNKLINVNRLPEALNLIDEALTKVDAAPKDKTAFADLQDHHAWALAERSSVLMLMGRNEDALAAQTKAREVAAAAGQDPISNKINLGDLLNELGKPGDALVEVKDVDTSKTSKYGVMAAEEVRACAHAQSGNKANLAKTLDKMRAHADDGYPMLQSALLCANELDEAAKRLIAQLDDPVKRGPVLATLQTYLPRPHPTIQQTIHDGRLVALIARPDVQAAIVKYGIVRRYPAFSYR